MPATVRLRASRPADRTALHRVWQSAVRATHNFLSAEDFEFFSRMVRDEYLPSRRFVVASDDAGAVVGFLGAADNEIEALFVDAGYRGQGIGRALLGDLLARDGELFVEVNEQNGSARGFYERLGFRAIGRSELDGSGRPYPILRMRRAAPMPPGRGPSS